MVQISLVFIALGNAPLIENYHIYDLIIFPWPILFHEYYRIYQRPMQGTSVLYLVWIVPVETLLSTKATHSCLWWVPKLILMVTTTLIPLRIPDSTWPKIVLFCCNLWDLYVQQCKTFSVSQKLYTTVSLYQITSEQIFTRSQKWKR